MIGYTYLILLPLALGCASPLPASMICSTTYPSQCCPAGAPAAPTQTRTKRTHLQTVSGKVAVGHESKTRGTRSVREK
jgi:hypothetical protein